MEVSEAIKGKIEKLIKLSSSPNEHEASLALAKAQELMQQYSIAFADLVLDESKTTIVDVQQEIVMKDVDDWEGRLCNNISKIFDVKCIYNQYWIRRNLNKVKHRDIQLFGLPDDLLAAKAMIQMVHKAILTIAASHFALMKAKGVIGAHRGRTLAYKYGWFLGCGQRICERVEEQRRHQLAQDNKMTALVIRKAELVDNYIKNLYGKLEELKQSKARASQLGYDAGVQAGNSIALNKQVN